MDFRQKLGPGPGLEEARAVRRDSYHNIPGKSYPRDTSPVLIEHLQGKASARVTVNYPGYNLWTRQSKSRTNTARRSGGHYGLVWTFILRWTLS
ncbi:hypothetical protein PoB_001764600 [Plakobranchus ocellatus]|uniref:Uncharacterized protein n=1 Tax=Plakobranchus ocellatus TaxID=259542 RepID=A0AAV3Z5J7_9GAST|nr:hypothetical protein PoB_001764600 [Plakobranchus ocellatus]